VYETAFGLTRNPFLLTPDPDLLLQTPGHRRALAYLEYGLYRREGFVVLTGEIGAGKTTLVRTLLATLDPEEIVAVNLVSSQIDGADLLHYLARALEAEGGSDRKSSALASIEARLYELHDLGQRVLLVIDEAQNLSRHAIEELRMLSNFQVGAESLLQIFLVGQPDLRDLMLSRELDQLRQRVVASCHLGALSEEETAQYVRHRLELSGWDGRPSFDDGVLPRVHEFTGGIPRRINLLCDRLLLDCHLSGRTSIELQATETVIDELLTELGPLTGDLARIGSGRRNVVAMDDARLMQRIAAMEERLESLDRQQRRHLDTSGGRPADGDANEGRDQGDYRPG
jgi:general secretion pathway protein A